ncbi:MAG: hypothetical protein AAFV07_14740 [Bacteroidota bacterium]
MAQPVFRRAEYGIYTVGDENFFAGVVAAINALRYYGYSGPVAVIDIGFQEWMVDYLRQFESVRVLSIEPVKRQTRFTDVCSEDSPVMQGWAYKAFSIVHYDLFDQWTFIDADYLPLCNLEKELRPFIQQGKFVSTEDGVNNWDAKHEAAIGVAPGAYMNINAGFVSLDMEVHGAIVHEWRNLMTRRKPFDLWYGDQGALNAILDKYDVEKFTVEKTLWNQTWLNESMAREGQCELMEKAGCKVVWYHTMDQRIMGWHGVGWHKLWHQIGIDHYRKDRPDERERFYVECQGKSPAAIVEIFRFFLFMDTFNTSLARTGHLLTLQA